VRRAVMAHLLTDEAFALSIAHFTRIGRTDERGYWIAAILGDLIPWNVATLAGVLIGQEIPRPERFGFDIVFPAAMVGLAAGLVTGRREIVAAIAGAVIGVAVGLVVSPSVGIIAGGLLGPAAGLAVPRRQRVP
jgi:predicted branched-subunit amino acid permease